MKVLLLLLTIARSLHAGEFLVLNPSDGAGGATFYGDGYVRTAGYEFTVDTSPLWALALGVRDWDGTGLVNPHEIGLWDSGTNLLAQVTVSPGTSTSGFRYAAMSSPVLLESGQSYIVGASYVNVDADKMGVNQTFDKAPPVYHPAVTFETVRFGDSTTGLAFPNLRGSAADLGLFGPNVEFQVVPEPSSVVLFAWASAIAFCFRKR